ncbi:hypothetical protein [Cumulibacter manganitolerans]|uniref:hypothetical protein n=1 Tax=Cumulibacter manganitolerans TaxID=1884992 RepID=UPI001295C408|nr:hypothetical protein [Cumulibacter manganitolerans]
MDSAVLEQWRLAAELGSRGLYGQAEGIVTDLLASGDLHARVLGEALLGSHRRQLGDPACARFHDDLGLQAWEASSLEADWPYVDLLINRAADAVGLGDLDDTGYWLRTAEALAASGDPRTAVRAEWVRAELLLARDEPAAALAVLDGLQLPLARLRSPRHAVRSRMLRGSVLQALGEDDAARVELDRALADAVKGLWHSLVWPAALVRARLARDGVERDRYLDIARAMIELILLDLHPSRAAAFEATLPKEITPEIAG